jgi:glycosyltransferase involved in cell wall biosynthesis
MTISRPLVSILIPSYKPRFFEQALLSALAQTWANTEILVSDNCPTNAIAEICARYPTVEYVRNNRVGAVVNWEHLVDRARGEHLKFLLDDDLLHPLNIQILMEPFVGPMADDFTMSFSRRWLIDADGGVLQRPPVIEAAGSTGGVMEGTSAGLRVTLPAKVMENGALGIPGEILIRMALVYGVNFVGELTTTLFRKSDIVENSPSYFDFLGEQVEGLADIASSCFLATRGHAWYVPETLSFFRLHGDQNSNPSVNPGLVKCVTDWSLLIESARAGGLLTTEETVHGLKRSLVNAKPYFGEMPELGPWAEGVMGRIRALEGSAT